MSFALTIHPQNALVSFKKRIWGLPETSSCRHFCENICDGLLIFFHVTYPVSGIVGVGEILGHAFEDTRPLYPQSSRNYPYRFKFRIISLLSQESWRLRAIKVPRLSYSQGRLSSVNSLHENEVDLLLAQIANWSSRRIFVSYSHRDADACLDLVRALEAYGIRSWVDRARIRIGDDLPVEIRREIIKADYFVPLVSKHSAESEWVLREIKIALAQEHSKHVHKILPVRIDDHPVPRLLKSRVYADFRNGRNLRRELEKLARRIVGP